MHRSPRDWQYKIHSRPRNWRRHDDIECRTNVFLEVSTKFCSRNNEYDHPTSFVDDRRRTFQIDDDIKSRGNADRDAEARISNKANICGHPKTILDVQRLYEAKSASLGRRQG